MSAGDVALTAEVELCKRGHPLTPENIVRQADGRRCRTCKRDAARRRSRRASAMRTGKYTLTRADLLTVNADRFWTKVARSAPDECWEWTGARSRGGYGQCFVSTRRTNTSAHRVSWVLSGNDLDPSQDLDHLCRNTSCVNPAHLEPVPGAVNNARSESPTAKNARKTHCTNGHEFTPLNTYTPPKRGGRYCRTCRRIADTKRRAVA